MERSEILKVAKPILFNTDMVRAIMDGRKTVTRRCVKPKYSNTEIKLRTDKYGTRLIEIQKDIEGETYGTNANGSTWHKLRGYIEPKQPYQPGDYLYVRETWCKENKIYYHRADFDSDWLEPCETLSGGYPFECTYYPGCEGCTRKSRRIFWRPSIHMPKEAARLFLRVTEVRVERLQEMAHDGALKEGIQYCGCPEGFTWKSETDMNNCYLSPMGAMEALWDSTISKKDLSLYGWDANPWVWVINFEKLLVS